MPFWSRIFGSAPADPAPATGEDYRGFRITPDPMREPGGYRVAARIEMVVAGETRVHRMIRADVCASPEAAREMTLLKARVLIDEQGERIFG